MISRSNVTTIKQMIFVFLMGCNDPVIMFSHPALLRPGRQALDDLQHPPLTVSNSNADEDSALANRLAVTSFPY